MDAVRSARSTAGDVFGLDFGSAHRLTAEAITDTTVRLVKRRSLETAAGSNVRVAHNLWTMTAGDHGTPKIICCCLAARPRWKRLPHFSGKCGNLFHRGLAAKQQHMIFGVP